MTTFKTKTGDESLLVLKNMDKQWKIKDLHNKSLRTLLQQDAGRGCRDTCIQQFSFK